MTRNGWVGEDPVSCYRRPTPAGLRRELLVPFLSYKLQECTFGGLKPSTRVELLRIAQEDSGGR